MTVIRTIVFLRVTLHGSLLHIVSNKAYELNYKVLANLIRPRNLIKTFTTDGMYTYGFNK